MKLLIKRLGAKNVLLWDRVPPEKIAALHDELKRLSPGYTEKSAWQSI